MSSIDERVVEMRFDNQQFEKNVRTSLNTLDKLKAALKLDGSTRGIEELQKATNNFNVDPLTTAVNNVTDKFSTLGIVGTTALINITNKAINAGEALIKSLSVDNISAGWDKFGEKTRAVGTLVGQGYDLSYVEEQMKRLNWFTDETSYNFTDMVSNISKFTATGKDLNESVSAMEGIALWAAASGQNATKASMAMYQLSQAMGKGVLKYDDWKSIQNASMDTKEFREQALKAAENLGKVKKVADDLYEVVGVKKPQQFSMAEMFSSDALSRQQWFSDEVMMEVFQSYNKVTDQIRDYVKEQQSLGRYITSSTAIEELGDQLDELGVKWFKAGMEARTFEDVIDATKDAVSTGWMNSFELIFGNYEEATKMWTGLSETMYELFAESGNFRNDVLFQWKDLGGRTALLTAIATAFENIRDAVSKATDAFHDFFPDDVDVRADFLLSITGALLRMAEGMKLTESASENVYQAFRGVFSVVSLVIDAFKAFAYVITPLATPLNLFAGAIFELIGSIGKFISQLVESIKESKGVSAAIETIRNAVAGFANIVSIGITIVTDFIKSLHPLRTISVIFNGLRIAVDGFINSFKAGISQFKGITVIGNRLKLILYGVLAVLYSIGDRLASFFNMRPLMATFHKIYTVAYSVGGSIASFVGTLVDSLVPYFDKLTVSAMNFFTKLVNGLNGTNKFGFFETLKNAVGLAVSAFTAGAVKIGDFFKAFTGATSPLGAILGVINSVAKGVGGLGKVISEAINSTAGMDSASAKFRNFFNVLAEYAKKIDVAKVAIISFGITSAYAFWQIGNAMTSFAKMMKSLSDIPDTLTKIAKSFTRNNATKSMRNVAVSIALLAGSLALLTVVDPHRLALAGGMMVILGAGILAISKAINTFGAESGFSKNAKGLIAVTLSMLVLVGALSMLNNIEFNHLLESLLVLSLFGAGLVAASKFLELGAKASLKPAISLYIFALSIKKVVDAFNALTVSLDADSMQSAMNTLITLVLGVIAVSYAASKLSIGKAAGLLVVCLFLNTTMNAIKELSDNTIDPKILFGIFGVMVALVALFGIIGKLVSSVNNVGSSIKFTLNAITPLLALTASLLLVVISLEKLKNMGLGLNGETLATVLALVAVVAAIVVLIKKTEGMEGPAKNAALAAVAFGLALSLFAKAFDVVAKTPKENWEKTLLMFGFVAACMYKLIEISGKSKGANPAAIMAMVAAIGIIAAAIALLTTLDVGKAVGVSIGLAVAFLGLSKVFESMANAVSEVEPKTALAFMGVIGFLTAALIALAVVPIGKALVAVVGLSIVLMAFAAATELIAKAANSAKGAMEGAKAILVASLALLPAAIALSLIAQYDIANVIGSAVALGIIMATLCLASKYAKGALDVAATLLIMSGSLVLSAYALKMLAELDPNSLIQAGIALAAVLGAFTLLSLLALTPVGEGMIILAAALAIFAAGLMGIGAAALMFGAGVALVVAAIQSLANISTEEAQRIAENLPLLMSALGEGLAEGIVSFFETLITKVLGYLGGLVVAILSKGPEFLSAGVDLITNFVTGMFSVAEHIVSGIASILTSAVQTIVGFVTTFVSMGVQIISALLNGILSVGGMIIVGVLNVLNNVVTVARSILRSFIDLGANIVWGIVEGIASTVSHAVDGIVELAHGIINKFCEVLGIHSPSEEFMDLAANIPLGAGDGITEAAPYAADAAGNMGLGIIDEAGKYINYSNGASLGLDFSNGVINTIDTNVTSYVNGLDFSDGLFAGGKSMLDDFKKKFNTRKAAKIAASEQERLEKEMGWNQKKSEKSMEERMTEAVSNAMGDVGSGGGGGGGGKGGGGGAAKEAVKETAKEVDKLTNIMDYASDEVMRFKTEWAETEHGLSDTQALSVSKDALELLALQLYENSIASETAEEAAERMGKTQAEVAADIKQAYLDMKKGVQETLQGQIDMFKMFDFGETSTADDMLERAKSNKNALLDYGESISKLGEKVAGIRGGEKVLQHFVDEGATSLGDLKGVLAMSADQLQEYLSLFEDMPNLLDYATESTVSSMAYVGYRAAGGFAEGLNPEEGAAAADTFSVAILDKLREKFGVNLQGDGVSTVTKSIGEGIAKGITTSLDGTTEARQATTQSEQLGSDISTAINDKATDGSYEIGKNICEGIAKGISDNASTAINAAIDMAVSALEGAKDALGINSPSKAFEDVGFYSDQGLANGLFKYGSIVREAAADTAYSAVDELSGVFGHIADLVDGSLELDPTIRPVLDLTNLANGNTAISSMLGLNDPYALNAAYAGIQNDGAMIADLTASFNRAIDKLNPENGETRDIVIHIYPTENQNPEDIANAVSYKINHEVLKKSAARGGAS